MEIDAIAARSAQQNVLDAKTRTQDALRKYGSCPYLKETGNEAHSGNLSSTAPGRMR